MGTELSNEVGDFVDIEKSINNSTKHGFIKYGKYGNCPPILPVPLTDAEIQEREKTFKQGYNRKRLIESPKYEDQIKARIEIYEALRLVYFVTQGRKAFKSRAWAIHCREDRYHSSAICMLSVVNTLKDFARCCYLIGRYEECSMACERVIEIINTYQKSLDSSHKSYAYYIMSFCMVDLQEYGKAQIYIDVVRNLDTFDTLTGTGGSAKMASCQRYLDCTMSGEEFVDKKHSLTLFKPNMLKLKESIRTHEKFGQHKYKYDIHIPPLDPRNMEKYKKFDDLLVERFAYVSDEEVLEEMEEGKYGFRIRTYGSDFLVWKVLLAL